MCIHTRIIKTLLGTGPEGRRANNCAAPASYTNSSGEIGSPCVQVLETPGQKALALMAVINCEANRAAITGGATANNIPTAGFATFFMHEAVPTTGPSSNRNLVGEMIGFANLVGGGVSNRPPIFNNVQLYR